MQKRTEPFGKVVFIGAGPGDPELITVKAIKYLQKADIILTDRLVSRAILDEYVHPGAEIIYVGKQCRKKQSTPQITINELLVEKAKQFPLVVRLKGGDVSIFSNILDELETLVENHVDYEIIPGVTAALGAAAYAGIPLTARNYANGVRFITYYKADVIDKHYWNELASTSDTLVFYMSSETLPEVVKYLKDAGIDEEKEIAVIEQGTTPHQNVYTSTFNDYNRLLGTRQFVSPSIIIIGKVVQLHDEFIWMTNSGITEPYFPEINLSPEKEVNNVTRA